MPDPENKCPECLFLDLEKVSILEGILKQPSANKIDLYFTINFNEQWENLIIGRVKFGIRGGELRLKLDNGKIPYASRSFNSPLSVSTVVEIELGQSSENVNEVGASLSVDKPGLTAKRNEKSTLGRKEKFQETIFNISTKGSEEKPTWVFKANRDDMVMIGTLTDKKLATMEIISNPYSITATFEISMRDVRLTDSEGLPSDISRNKWAWIERRIILWLLESKLKPYMSKVEL